MTTPITTDEFLALTERSGLLPPDKLAVFAERARSDSTPVSSESLARQLIRERLLTPFQARQLLRGRYRGFFLTEKYKILELLGEGGMGRVLLCEHLMLHKLVAVKLLQMSGATMPGAAERFLREARAAAGLDHPNIARVYDVDKAGVTPFMVMEYVDGTNLHQVVADHGPLSVERAAEYIRQSAQGLQHAHENGLVHRDIKPGNLILDRNGSVKMLDLGLARFFDSTKNENLTQKFDEKSILGTADFISPEQAMNSSKVDIRADIYSLGCTFYYLLTRRFPFDEGSVTQKLLWHQTKQPSSIKDHRPDVPDDLIEIIEKMMAKKPADRFQTPAEIVEALTPFGGKFGPPPLHEMPKVKPSTYQLGISAPPSPAVLGLSSVESVTPSPNGADQPTGINTNRRAGGSTAGNTPPVYSATGNHPPIPPSQWSGSRPPVSSVSPDTPRPGYHPADPASYPAIPPHLLAQLTPAELSGLMQTQRIPQPRSKKGLIIGLSLGGIAALAMVVIAVVMLKGSGTTQTTDTGKSPTTEPGPVLPLADVHGAGSTFVQPLMKEWAAEYVRLTNGKVTYNPDPTAKYGSGFGIKGMTSRDLDFGCTDAPMDGTQLATASNKGGAVIHVPLAMGAVVPIYNVPELRGELRFTSELLAKIYLGHVTKWNDPAVKAANPTRANDLPSYDIKVVHRGTNSSGTSYIWTEFLASGDSEVREANKQFATEIGVSTTPKWREGGIGAPGNSEVAKAVQDNKGAIGYVELRFALSKNLTYGRVRNREDKFVEATLESVTAAADSILGGADFPRDLRFSLINPPGPRSYPISGTVWAIVYVVPKSPEAGRATAEFLWWCVHDGQKLAEREQYAILPDTLIKRTEDMIRRMRGGENLGKK